MKSKCRSNILVLDTLSFLKGTIYLQSCSMFLCLTNETCSRPLLPSHFIGYIPPQLQTKIYLLSYLSFQAVKPSPAIKNNITNVLAAYAFIMRYFNGEIEPGEAVIYLLNICDNLDSNANFDDPAIALESVAQKCLQVIL